MGQIWNRHNGSTLHWLAGRKGLNSRFRKLGHIKHLKIERGLAFITSTKLRYVEPS